MFDIAWCEKYDLSVLCLLYKFNFINKFNFKRTFASPTFIKKEISVAFYKQKNIFRL